MEANVCKNYKACPIFTGACAEENNTEKNIKSAKIKFKVTAHNYDEIEMNSEGTCEFKLISEGQETLILPNVLSSCACTVPPWPKELIKKGEEAVIKVNPELFIRKQFSC